VTAVSTNAETVTGVPTATAMATVPGTVDLALVSIPTTWPVGPTSTTRQKFVTSFP